MAALGFAEGGLLALHCSEVGAQSNKEHAEPMDGGDSKFWVLMVVFHPFHSLHCAVLKHFRVKSPCREVESSVAE